MLNSTIKHSIHCLGYVLTVSMFEILSIFYCDSKSETDMNQAKKFGYALTIILCVLQLLPLLALPFVHENVLGMLMFNAFQDEVTLEGSTESAPFICFRVVTRGTFPTLVKRNVELNRNICIDAGLKHFCVEVVTDKAVGVQDTSQTKEVVVPESYETKSGVLYKGRALQYCLEDKVNDLDDDDWIVHLDEETLLTTNVIYGIVNFIAAGEHQFGQGVIAYAKGDIVHWLTTVADNFRVAEDFGRLKWEIKGWHRPLSGWKGSFMVVQAGAERKVGFDNGQDSSLAEDNFFSMKAIMHGYSFGDIAGEMWEMSPFTISDFIRQHKRWMMGLYALVHSSQFPFRLRFLSMWNFYLSVFLPFTPLVGLCGLFYPLPRIKQLDFIFRYMFSTTVYMHIFGGIKSFSISKHGLFKFLVALVSVVVAVPFGIITQTVVAAMFYCGENHNFYIVDKEAQMSTERK